MRNTQQPEKAAPGNGTVIAVNSIFYTIQGEGPFAGTPAVFVRLAGCNLQCPMCDTEYTRRDDTAIADIVHAVAFELVDKRYRDSPPSERDLTTADCSLVVITGGEPFRQPIGLLIQALIKEGFRVQVETNGSLFQPAVNYFDEKLTIVCSPKTGQVNRQLLPYIKAFKYVATAESLEHSEDGLPVHALGHAAAPMLFRPPLGHPAEIYLQPVDERNIQANYANQAAVVQSCLKHGYRLCLQVHKIIGVD